MINHQKNESLNLDEVSFDPLLKFINQSIMFALEKHASDIHFEPFANSYRVRARINGLLVQINQAETQIAARLASRLKVIAGLDIAEQRLPQDGRIKVIYKKQQTTLRISTCCTVHGEKIVLRLFNNQKLPIEQLGFSKTQQQLFLQTINKPQGLVLVCGPTGSGKTITLYAALQALNQTERNIVSIEDPVEIYLNGINQVNVNQKINLSFYKALRSFLRQDPDVIMLGEIRDKETAEAAIKAAQTGHLVLATLHSNSAVKAITRLRNMGISNYDLADSLSLVVSQRLVRKACQTCQKNKNVHCDQCIDGYQGRVSLFELLPINEAIESAIADNQPVKTIRQLAKQAGIKTLAETGAEAVAAGITSLNELKRVISYENIHLDSIPTNGESEG